MKSLLTVSAFVLASSHLSASARRHEAPLPNANDIFNAIHSSMRQFGSSLNQNGMSIFLATVPADTEFYHGTNSPYCINGTEWLAFEPEHPLIFAQGRRGPPGRGRGPPGEGPPKSGKWDNHYRDELPRHPHNNGDDSFIEPPFPLSVRGERKQDLRRHEKTQHLLHVVAENKPALAGDEDGPYGYLYTYRTKHALTLLYVDGQSAAKSGKGTLSTQDMVLLHHHPPPNVRHSKRDEQPERPHHGPMGEMESATGMCRLAREEYGGRIDGILRMEAGFEIILCDFKKGLDVVRIAQTKSDSGMGPGGPGRDNCDAFNYYEAVAVRYDGIGGGRVNIDCESFVTLFALEDAVYFDDHGRPRVNNEKSLVEPIRTSINKMALGSDAGTTTINWQATANMIVARYTDRIALLVDVSQYDDLKAFRAEADRAMRPFVDYGHRDEPAEVARCASQFLPSKPGRAHSTAYSAILNVTTIVCRTLLAASEFDTLPHGVSVIRALKSWLGWTTWKRCRGCGPDEVCFVPIWPVGSQEDFKQPRCRSDISEAPSGYWRGFGRPPGDGIGGPPPDPEMTHHVWRPHSRARSTATSYVW